MGTRQSKVVLFVTVAMLNRDDVLDLIGDVWFVRLPRVTVFAPIFGALTGQESGLQSLVIPKALPPVSAR